MMWLILIIAVIGILIMMRKKPAAEITIDHEQNAVDESNIHSSEGYKETNGQDENDDLIVILAAAIAEFENANGFKVLHVRATNNNWVLTSRQDIMRARL